MTIKSPRSVAGLALALLLALFGGVTATAGGGGITETPAEDAPEGRVIAASAREASAPVLADLDGLDFDPTTTTATAVPADVAAAGEPAAEPVGEAAPVEAAPTTTAPAPAPAPQPAPAPEPAPEPAPTPAPAPTSVEAIIESYFGPNTPKALAVARCESGLNPNAMSPGGGNHGLFQINNVHSGNFQAVTGAPWSARYDVHANTAFAKWLFDQSGWGPWACA